MTAPFCRTGVLLWLLALLLTAGAAEYQRMTGPTHPRRGAITVEEYEAKKRELLERL